jgi:hypothetical protein
MSTIRRDLNDVITLAEMLASLVENQSVFIQVFSLSNYWQGLRPKTS